MPAPLDQDAVSYLKQQGLPVTTTSLNRTMGLLQQQPNLRPSYAGQGSMDVDVETMKPVYNTKIEGRSLPPLQSQGNTNSSFSQAFKAARAKLGAGQTFDWNGKKYTTDYKEEVGKKPGQGPAKVTSGDGTHDKFNEDEPEAVDNINEEAEEDIQQGLAEEKAGFAAMDEKKRNTKRVSAGRGGYVDVPMNDSEIADRDMNEMLDKMIAGGAAAAVGGAGLAAVKGNKESASYRQMPIDPTNPAVKGVGSPDDLAGGFEPEKPPVNNVNEMDEMFKDMFPDQNKAYATEVLKNADSYLPEEIAAAKAVAEGNNSLAKRMLSKLPKGSDKKLISIIKALQ